MKAQYDNYTLSLLSGMCLTLDDFIEKRSSIQYQLTNNINLVEHFIRFCDNQLILPAVFLKLKKHDLLNILPNELVYHLEYVYELNCKRNEGILSQIKEINIALKNSGIEPVYMKGTANLTDGLYSDIGERMIGDIDFLVSTENYLKTATILKELGYEDNFKCYGDLTKLKHYPRLFKKSVHADVEIHRLAVPEKYGKYFTPDMIFKEKKKISSLENCFVASDKHRIINNFIHNQLSNKANLYKTTSLRDIYDIYLLSKRKSLEAVLPEIENKKEARGYFSLSAEVLGLNHTFFKLAAGKGKSHVTSCRLAMQHPVAHYRYVRLIKLCDLVFIRYVGKILNAFYNKTSREYIYNRITDIHWYKIHFKGLKTYFS